MYLMEAGGIWTVKERALLKHTTKPKRPSQAFLKKE